MRGDELWLSTPTELLRIVGTTMDHFAQFPDARVNSYSGARDLVASGSADMTVVRQDSGTWTFQSLGDEEPGLSAEERQDKLLQLMAVATSIMKKDQSSPQQRKQLSKIFKDLKKLTRG